MKNKCLLLVFVCFIAVFMPAVSAVNATFSTLDQLGANDILIYEFNETSGEQTLYGMWNTSSVDVPLPEDDFNIIIRPSAQGRFATPGLFLADAFTYLEANAFPIIVIVFLIGLLWKK